MPKHYSVLECKNFFEINNELLQYVSTHTPHLQNYEPYRGLDRLLEFKLYANFVSDIKHFVQHCPKLVAWCKSYKLLIRDAYFTVLYCKYNHNGKHILPIHLDKPPHNWKINWPILNMEHTVLSFYTLKNPELDLQQLIIREGDPDSKDNDNYRLPANQFVREEIYDFSNQQPVLMNPSVPHDIYFKENPIFPRIGIQLNFFNVPQHLLPVAQEVSTIT